jgi:hypothetical protein
MGRTWWSVIIFVMAALSVDCDCEEMKRQSERSMGLLLSLLE